MTGAKNKAMVVLVCGSTDSGKSTWVKNQLQGVKRALVWDVNDEYQAEGFRRTESLTELIALLKQHPKNALRIAYVPSSMQLFDIWCRAALAWGDCVVVCEELADVTSPGKAPQGWGMVVRRGRHAGLAVFGITQRPSESDKTIMGNARIKHVCKLERAEDRRYMERELDITPGSLDDLESYAYIERRGGKLIAGKTLGNGNIQEKPITDM